MRYFSHLAAGYATKNKLEEAVNKFISQNNRSVIESRELESFKSKIIDGIEFLNGQFKRCHPVKAEWHNGCNYEEYGDLRLDLSTNIVRFYLYAEKEVET